MRVINRAKKPVAFRDDAGKHILAQYESVDVQGDQHLVHILSLPGISPTKQEGGPVRPSKSYTVGERGSEVFVPDPFNDDFTEDPDGDPVEYRDGDL